MFTQSRPFRFMVFGSMFFLVATHLITIILFVTSTTPFSCYWLEVETDEDYDAVCNFHFDVKPVIVFISGVTILYGLFILALPCPTVWQLQMAKRQKFMITAIFTGWSRV